MFWIVWSLIIGFVIGAIARFLMPGRDPMGCFMTALLGIGGSLLGGFIANLLWPYSGRGFRPAGFLLSLVGAMILLGIWRAVSGRRR